MIPHGTGPLPEGVELVEVASGGYEKQRVDVHIHGQLAAAIVRTSSRRRASAAHMTRQIARTGRVTDVYETFDVWSAVLRPGLHNAKRATSNNREFRQTLRQLFHDPWIRSLLAHGPEGGDTAADAVG